MISRRRNKTLAAAFLLGPALLSGAAAVKPIAGATENTGASTSASVEASEAGAQATVPMSTYAKSSYPRVELFLGYSHFRGMPTYADGNRMVGLNGGDASLAFNLNRYLGLVADFGGYNTTKLNLTGPGANPAREADASGTVFSYMAGPRLSYRRRVTPFVQALFGAAHAGPVTLSNCTGNLCTPLPAQTSFAMTAGAGVDVTLQRHLALRLVQAEYMMTRFADVTTGAGNTQNDLRLSTGLVLRFGGQAATPPVSYACSASPSSVYPGDPIMVTGTALNLNPKKTAVYTWSTDGAKVSGSGATVNIDSKDAAPGTYTVKGHVSEGHKLTQSADCDATYTVMAFQPPTVSCSAEPSSVRPGESATITARGMSPQNRPLSYSYSASEGSVSGATSTATLTTGPTSGPITVTCNVTDDKGQSASSTTVVAIQAPPATPAPVTQKLCSIHFDRDAQRPTRVDNEAKACLDDVALNLQHSPDAKVAIEGSAANAARPNSRVAMRNASQRAVNTKDYLVTGKGIDSSRVAVYTGSTDSNVVEIVMIPSGASIDLSGLTPADDSVKAVPRGEGRRTHRNR
jgi:hypothetical protein